MWHVRLMISGSLRCHRRHRIRIFRRELSASFYLGVWISRLNFSPRFTTCARTRRKLARIFPFFLSLSLPHTVLFRLARTHARTGEVYGCAYEISVCIVCASYCTYMRITRVHAPYVLRMSGHLSWTNTLIRERRPHYTPHATGPCYDYITLL